MLILKKANMIRNRTTAQKNYTNRLINKQFVWWKNIFGAQLLYRWNIKRMSLGFVLDLGCGIGRNLIHLEGNGIGIDHNVNSVNFCRNKGLKAYTNQEFKNTAYYKKELFDSILLSHVAEHMNENEIIVLLKAYLPLVKKGGQIVVITPQEAGYRSDSTHVAFVNFNDIDRIFKKLDIIPIKKYSFPLPKIIGKIFKYNEFIGVGKFN
jgi:SAM-dependent methyltransferase